MLTFSRDNASFCYSWATCSLGCLFHSYCGLIWMIVWRKCPNFNKNMPRANADTLLYIVAVNALLFFLFCLIPLTHRILYPLLFVETSRVDLKLLTQCVEWSQFTFQHYFGNITYGQKLRVAWNFGLLPPSVRDIELPRCCHLGKQTTQCRPEFLLEWFTSSNYRFMIWHL